MQSQTSTIFGLLDEAKQTLLDILNRYEPVDEGHDYPWPNHVWRSRQFRRAHLDIVDVREERKLYMMHLTVFPHFDDGAPIFGFDLIAGPNRATGAFHDFSPIDHQHKLMQAFERSVRGCEWSKERTLPEWAQQIFSNHMVAAGNITDPDELRRVLALVRSNLMSYLQGVGEKGPWLWKQQQNNYCHWQKQNPHTPRVMQALGFDESTVRDFIQNCLFPEA